MLNRDEIRQLIDEVDASGKLTINLADAIKSALRRKFQGPQEQGGQQQGQEQEEAPEEEVRDFEFEELSSDIVRGIEGAAESPGGTAGPEGPETDEEKPVRKRQAAGPAIPSSGGSDASSGSESSAAASSEEGRGGDRNYGLNGWGRPARDRYNERTVSDERLAEIMANPMQYIEFVFENRRFRLKPVGTIEPVPKRIYRGSNGGYYYYKTHDENGNRINSTVPIYLKKYQRRQCIFGASERAIGLAGYVDLDDDTCFNQPDPARRKAARQPKTVAAAPAAHVTRRRQQLSSSSSRRHRRRRP